MDRFVLIDGNAILHRAFHALPPLTSKDGAIVNAVYGFFSMFLKILEDLKPSYIAVCFDRPKPTFRKALYVGYQAKRPKTSDEFIPQIAITHDILKAIHVSVFEVDGYEADDIIGTLARQIIDDRRLKVENGNLKMESRRSIEVIIVSGDRDLLQLVNSNVKVLAPITGITKTAMYDGLAVEEKLGIKPAQVIDYKALVGDASDNYPGVSGIGPKTAGELLRQYGSFENLYKHLDKLPEKIATRLAIDAEQAALAKKLATIVVDVPVSFTFSSCLLANMDKGVLQKTFQDLGFRSLLKRAFKDKEPEREEKQEEKSKEEQLGLL